VDSLLKNSKFLTVVEVERMWDTCAVELRVNLPKSVAAEVEEVQRNDPEMLSRMLYYAMTRRTIFDHLATRTQTAAHDVLTTRGKELR
jgi:hypothetical protein